MYNKVLKNKCMFVGTIGALWKSKFQKKRGLARRMVVYSNRL